MTVVITGGITVIPIKFSMDKSAAMFAMHLIVVLGNVLRHSTNKVSEEIIEIKVNLEDAPVLEDLLEYWLYLIPWEQHL